MRKAFIFCGGEHLLENAKPLRYLDKSMQKVALLLSKYGNWEVESFRLDNANNINKRLKNIDDDEQNEILFFYIGHGVPKNSHYTLIDSEGEEVLFENIIAPISAFSLTRFALIVDACHSNSALDSMPKADNIELVTSVSYGLAYESEMFELTNFVHYFAQAFKGSSHAITLEYICEHINQNDEVRQKPVRMPPKHTRHTQPITIATIKSTPKPKPTPNALLEHPTGQVPLDSIYYVKREDSKAHAMLHAPYSLIRIKKSKENPDWQKLKIILSHSTEPLLAQASLHQSPFHNVGLAMDLKAFSHQEIAHLAKTHNLHLLDEEIAKLTSYLGGHPYLTRKLLYEMSSEAKELLELLKPECFEEHLRRYLIAFEQNSALIDALRAMMRGESPKSEHGYILEATGFISASMHNAHFSSKLYQDFFITHFKDKS